MRRAAWYAVLALTLLSCNRQPFGVVSHRGSDGRPDQWVTRISAEEYQISIDTNGDGRPDLVKTVKGDQIVEVESDRNFNGQTDLVQQYARGVMVREVRDDNYDGRPETVKTFRPDGTLAIVERDPDQSGTITVIEYYDSAGHLTHREVRSK
jgi:hypothetical protein